MVVFIFSVVGRFFCSCGDTVTYFFFWVGYFNFLGFEEFFRVMEMESLVFYF